ncbi:TPA: TrkA family potassium uptake protein [Clostridium perfringens]|uniref:potassium channel family protein n=1 Tax=Clostridium perfringens TaxID=1502 RepID=UPI000E125C70|nr:TrkA family potassium uptake protein [Clostridium perfringens]EJT5916872.1 TrkA family potassium uptake protein [Clostridium perfringens]EJT5938509.1 TrkA family potassium uptake protein [Clostridium perfringens]EJT6135544.1 TrkA family potassium uptake protein [Clostridium perfringens]EJT6149732.1 TrkA family potassium uptake protein [Clostridium perfringens]EJT6155137.1 TrkA family potassium uptake protein [Clostridium perfringens]
MSSKQFVIIGLGRFGSSVAKTLYALGHDVLAIDYNEDLVQEISDSVTHAVQMDATDENALRTLGLRNFDVAVVTIGANIQASIMATLLVKDMGIKYIIAKGNSDLHAKVLYKIGADRVILPEKDMGVRVAHNLVSSSILDYIELSPDYSIIEIESPKEWYGKSMKELSLRSKYGINVMAIKRNNEVNISPDADDVINKDDIVVAIGSAEDLTKLEGKIFRH